MSIPSNKEPVTVRRGASLPEPDAEALQHSRRLGELIRDEIDACGGSIGFDRYMDMVLYQPGMGYYSAGTQKFGRYGDFVTAPEVSSLFSRCLARQSREILHAIERGSILELGAGTGSMAAEILQTMDVLGHLPERYYILELSGELRARQAETLKRRVPHLFDFVQWLDGFPQSGFRGVVLANEVLDAMPIHCFRMQGKGIVERRVGVCDHDGFKWIEEDAGNRLRGRVESVISGLTDTLASGYCSEINLRLVPWVQALSEAVEKAVVIFIDYGYPRCEYYHEQRKRGTLLCHYRHLAHEDPFCFPGLQDISANVDFTAVAEAGDAAGLQLLGYTSQAQFLLANGVADIIAEVRDEQQRWEYAQQIKRLTLPSEMGDRFQVMALGKAYTEPIQGFRLRDFRSRL